MLDYYTLELPIRVPALYRIMQAESAHKARTVRSAQTIRFHGKWRNRIMYVCITKLALFLVLKGIDWIAPSFIGSEQCQSRCLCYWLATIDCCGQNGGLVAFRTDDPKDSQCWIYHGHSTGVQGDRKKKNDESVREKALCAHCSYPIFVFTERPRFGRSICAIHIVNSVMLVSAVRLIGRMVCDRRN